MGEIQVRACVDVDLIDARKPEVPLRHPGIVLRVRDDAYLVVASGTGTARDFPHVLVTANSQWAKALGLTKDTYFYASGIVAAPPERVRPRRGTCPPNLFVKLLGLMNETSRE